MKDTKVHEGIRGTSCPLFFQKVLRLCRFDRRSYEEAALHIINSCS